MDPLSAIGSPFVPPWADLRPFLAEAWVIVTIVGVLVTPFFTPRRPNLPCAAVAFVGLSLALLSLIGVGFGHVDPGSANRFRDLLVADPFALLWKVMLLVFVLGILLMWLGTTSWTLREGDGPEFFTLLLGATLGMMLMASTANLLVIFLAVEMASLPSYVLAGFRKTHRGGAEASLKYVLFGAATSAVMVYGLTFLYGLYGTLQLDTTWVAGAAVPGLAAKMAAGSGGSALLAVAVFGLVVGLGFKVAAVPFHFWCPDVFEGASVEVSAFLSVASKGAALVLMLRVLMVVADAFGYQDAPHVSLGAIAGVVGVLGAVTCTVGNAAALVQTNVKRLLAYSSIAHAGYMLCALSLLLGRGGSPVTSDGMNWPAQALLLYLAVYLFMNLGAFTVAGLVSRQTGGDQLAEFAGLGRRSPLLAACMGCFLLSLIGLPPFAGFVAKVNVLWVLIQNGGGAWWWLVGVIGVNTVLSMYYYLRVMKVMYFEAGADAEPFAPHPIGAGVAVGCAAALVVMLLAYNPLFDLTKDYARVQGVDGATSVQPAATPPPPPPVAATR